MNLMLHTKSKKRFEALGLLVVALVLLVYPLLFAPSANALNAFIDPNNDGTATNWTAVPGATYSTAIDEATRQPTTPTTTDYISAAANAGATIFVDNTTVASASDTSQIIVWAYHNDGANGLLSVELFDEDETTAYGAGAVSFTQIGTSAWNSVTISGLSLTQGQLDTLSLNFTVSKSGGGAPATLYLYAAYADVLYTSGSLSVDIVDSGGTPVTSPSVGLTTLSSSFACQTPTGTLGASSEKIRVTNTTANGSWTLDMAATGGATDTWSDTTTDYDFNDGSGSPAGCGDGGDTDSLVGQLTVDPSVSTLTPEGGCTSTGISKGSSTAFLEGTTDSITLLTATSSDTSCYFDLIGIGLSQKVPSEVPASGSTYTVPMTITVTAV